MPGWNRIMTDISQFLYCWNSSIARLFFVTVEAVVYADLLSDVLDPKVLFEPDDEALKLLFGLAEFFCTIGA